MDNSVRCLNFGADFNSNFQVFETFKVEEKIEELKEFVKCPKLSVFENKYIIIVVPSFDESGRYIKKDDKELYLAQKSDARQLSNFLRENAKAKVEVVTNSDEIYNVVDSSDEPIDFLILLHEFIPSEKDYVVAEMKENHLSEAVNKHLKVIELY